LRELSQREGVTLFMTLLAGFAALLSRYSGQDDVVVGSPVAGRNYRETEGLIGFFVNTLPLRVKVGTELRFVELLQRVKEVCLGAYAHQDVPFEKLVEELQPRREASRSPLYQVVLTLENAPRTDLALGGLSLETLESGVITGKYELNFSLNESVEGIGGFLEYHQELYEEQTISKLLGDYERLLERAVAEPEVAVGQLRFLSAAEEHEVLVERNQTAKVYARTSLRQWLAETAARAAEQVAVVHGSEQWSYRELDLRGNQLAHYLRRQGVGAEVLVGLYLEPSFELVVGLLAILKAGGAYLPLDVGYPRQRLEQMPR
jgi:non-ribosomal peptide synthetase component F